MAPTTTAGVECEVHVDEVCAEEGKLIEHETHIDWARDCQAICQNHPGCAHWSHYREGGDGDHYWGNCFLYTSCQLFTSAQCFGPEDEECRDVPYDPSALRKDPHKCHCVSAPALPALEDCGGYPPTPLPCMDSFWPGQRCDDHNNLGHIEHIQSRSDCQAICQSHTGCAFFSHSTNDKGERGECWLHATCDLTDHDCDCRFRNSCNCFAGPAFPDMDDCSQP